MKEIMIILCILLIPIAIFLPPHLIIWVAKGLFGIDWTQKYWLVFVGWTILGMILKIGSK